MILVQRKHVHRSVGIVVLVWYYDSCMYMTNDCIACVCCFPSKYVMCVCYLGILGPCVDVMDLVFYIPHVSKKNVARNPLVTFLSVTIMADKNCIQNGLQHTI
jgi:hypothetical protein